jgi:hypothetical protein
MQLCKKAKISLLFYAICFTGFICELIKNSLSFRIIKFLNKKISAWVNATGALTVALLSFYYGKAAVATRQKRGVFSRHCLYVAPIVRRFW